MAKGRIEQTVDFINRDVFELFMRMLRHPQQTWRYLRERHRTPNHQGGLDLFARALLDCVLRFNPISIMLSAGVYAASHSFRLISHPSRLMDENSTKWGGVLLVLIGTVSLISAYFEPALARDIASTFGLGSFLPAIVGTAIFFAFTTLAAATLIYCAKSYAQQQAENQSVENIKTFTLNSNSVKENNTNVVDSIKSFTSNKYLIQAKTILDDYYTNKRTIGYDDAADATLCLLRHLAATRSHVKRLLQAGNIPDLAKLFPSQTKSLVAQEDHSDSLSCIGRAEKWLREVNKPALQAVYERIKTLNEAETHFVPIAEPDEDFIKTLTPCFNDKTPSKLHDTEYFNGSGYSDDEALTEALNNHIKPLFGPFTKKEVLSL